MSHSVLIIEDDDILRDIYSLKFRLEGFTVLSAADGVEGLEKVARSMPDIILLDMLMPRLGGLDFLRRFRSLDNCGDTVILVASNKSTDDMIAEAMRLGAADYLIKSKLTPDEIVTHARKHLTGTRSA